MCPEALQCFPWTDRVSCHQLAPPALALKSGLSLQPCLFYRTVQPNKPKICSFSSLSVSVLCPALYPCTQTLLTLISCPCPVQWESLWGGEATLHTAIQGSRFTPAGVSTNILGPGLLHTCRRARRAGNCGQKLCEPGLDAEDITSRHSSVGQHWSEMSPECRGGRESCLCSDGKRSGIG